MTWTTFANLTSIVTTEWDGNFAILSALVPIPCTVAGTNTLALTSTAGASTIAAYQNGMTLTGIVAATNTAASTAQLGSLATLNIYKDTPTGPQALSGGEMVQNCAISLRYDSTLNGGAGGFHLLAPNAPTFASSIVAPVFTAIGPSASQDQTVTFAGCKVSDVISIGWSVAPTASIVFNAYVAAAGSVIVRALNPIPATTITPGTLTMRLMKTSFL